MGWIGTLSYWPSHREVESIHGCGCVLAIPTELTLVLILRTLGGAAPEERKRQQVNPVRGTLGSLRGLHANI